MLPLRTQTSPAVVAHSTPQLRQLCVTLWIDRIQHLARLILDLKIIQNAGPMCNDHHALHFSPLSWRYPIPDRLPHAEKEAAQDNKENTRRSPLPC
jgi:hypothetical protein